MEESAPAEPQPQGKGGTYCCVINCSNNAHTVDPRTRKPVKLHSFPNPQKDKEKCQRWLVNIRRKHLTMSDIRWKKVCSVHFEIAAYSCPSDISSSRLLSSAVPTLVDCPNPPKPLGVKRKLPQRHIVCEKKIKTKIDIDMCAYNEPEIDSDTSPVSTSNSCLLSEQLKQIQAELEKVKQEKNQALEELKNVKNKFYLLNRKYKRALKRCTDIQLSARKYVEKHSEPVSII